MMKQLTTIFFLGFYLLVSGQQEITVMNYNLLNYGVISSYCTLDNNDPADKTQWAKTIVDYYLPDILVVNEMSPSTYYHDLFLDDVMNASGRDNYARAAGTNLAGSNIVNMLYFNADILGLAGQEVIDFWLRDINVYRMYYKSAGLPQNHDTTFLYIVSAHFKAGTGSSDKTTRAQMATAVMDFLEENQVVDACLMCGDLNLQNNLEPAWSGLTGGSADYRFIDPAGMEGVWHNNADYALLHTQSTQTEYDGCKASGGMDDRFDFILANTTLMDSGSKLSYVEGSYDVPGQDGLRLNGSLIDPPNSSAPADVIEAMFNLSDHLPVVVGLEIEEENPLPESWSYTVTGVSHTLYLPMEVQPTLNAAPLAGGAYIGMFYTDDGTAYCAGYKQWYGGTDIQLKCYGNDASGRAKNGFYENEPVIFKIFDVQQQTAFFADADFSPAFPDDDGRFHANGVSALNGLDAAYLQYHTIEVDAGWNSISSFLTPGYQTIETVFGANLSKVIYMQDGDLELYPGGGVLALKYWTEKSSFILKAEESFTINVEGLPADALHFDLFPGWNMIPVPVPCYVFPGDLDTDPAGEITAIRDIAGEGVFWPAKAIHTLELMVPGNAYLIQVNNACSLTFESCK